MKPLLPTVVKRNPLAILLLLVTSIAMVLITEDSNRRAAMLVQRLASIAEELKLSPRTLQRKLSDAGATFQQILDQARFALAKDYLRQPELSLVDIAFLLGYQEQSAFNHAFKEWAGVNPGAYRS